MSRIIRIASAPVHLSLPLFFLSTPVGYPSRCHSFTTPLFLKYDTLRLYITPDSILLQVSVDSFATFWHYVALVPSRDTAS